MDSEIRELLRRGVIAVEHLAQDPVVEVEAKPPVCPNCNRMNPNITVSESEATGAMAEFVIQARCNHCMTVFYAIPVMWENVMDIEAVRTIVQERAELSGFNERKN